MRSVMVPRVGRRVHPRQIAVSKDRQHACLFRCARVDRFDAPICDRALNNYRAYGARTANVGRVCGATADFKVTICAWDRLSDGAHARPPAIVSARRATRWASSTLNPLCPSGRASLNEAAMPILSVPISSSLAPRSAASADVSRHGLWATPPSASRTERMRPRSTATAAAGNEREFVGSAITQFQVMRGTRLDRRRDIDRHNQLPALERGIVVRRVPRQAVKVRERDRPFSGRTQNDDMSIERGKRNGKVGGVRRNAVIGPAEDRMAAIEAMKRRAAGAWPTLVAWKPVLVAEIRAARSLHDVAADRRHVAELARGGEQQGLGDNGELLPDVAVGRHVAHSRKCADVQPAVRSEINPRQTGETVYVQQPLGSRSAILDQAEEVRTAGDECQLRVTRVLRDGVRGSVRP